MKIWVAGFGNEHREDDAAGVILAERIHKYLASLPGVEVSLCLERQLLPELAEELDVDLAIFCDADTVLHEGGFSLGAIAPNPCLNGFNIHSMGPEWLLALAEQAATPPMSALLLTVSGESFDFSQTPTTACQRRIEKAEEAFRSYWENRRRIDRI